MFKGNGSSKNLQIALLRKYLVILKKTHSGLCLRLDHRGSFFFLFLFSCCVMRTNTSLRERTSINKSI